MNSSLCPPEFLYIAIGQARIILRLDLSFQEYLRRAAHFPAAANRRSSCLAALPALSISRLACSRDFGDFLFSGEAKPRLFRLSFGCGFLFNRETSASRFAKPCFDFGKLCQRQVSLLLALQQFSLDRFAARAQGLHEWAGQNGGAGEVLRQ